MKKNILLAVICSLLALPAQAQFIDVDVTHPYFHSIADLHQSDIIDGYEVNGARFFRPRQSINRAEALKILMLSAGIELDQSNAGSQFPDVPGSAWFTDYVRTASERGIVKGYADGKFYPEAKVTRAEFVKMLIESFEVPLIATSEIDWFAPYINTATASRLLPEEDLPHDHITRGEVAEIIFRATQVALDDYNEKYTYRATGKASYYNEGFAGRSTANGEIYDPYGFTAAHRTLPFDTRLRVYNQDGKFIVVRINDRGPYHEDRVLDLSERAFEELAPISRGVINVDFEVLSDPQDVPVAIPEQIRPNLQLESRNPEVPISLYDRLRTQTGQSEVPEKMSLPDTQPLFNETISSLSTDFYPNVELRHFVPQRLVTGQVLRFSGRITDRQRPELATVFLQNKSTGDQQHFSDELSGQNFEIAVPFYEAGQYTMGLVFDDDRTSRVAPIEVVDEVPIRRFAASDSFFASDLAVDLVPEDQLVSLSWSTDAERLSRLIFEQEGQQKILTFEHGINYFQLPYDFLATDFAPDTDLMIALEQAESRDGTWSGQTTNWKSVTDRAFRLVAGFPDKEQVGALSLSDFSRYYRDLSPIEWRGQILDTAVRIADQVYITYPDGDIEEVEPIFTGTRTFTFALTPDQYGRYIIEIVSQQGDILFNRAVYFDEAVVLPVLPKEYTDIKLRNKSGILHWINTIRASVRRPVLVMDSDLEDVAQAYANRMARENFIAHVSPDGQTLTDRIANLDFQSYGENLAFGSTLDLALNGLEDSASHYKNIKSTTWKKVGIGLTENAQGEVYVVQIFAK